MARYVFGEELQARRALETATNNSLRRPERQVLGGEFVDGLDRRIQSSRWIAQGSGTTGWHTRFSRVSASNIWTPIGGSNAALNHTDGGPLDERVSRKRPASHGTGRNTIDGAKGLSRIAEGCRTGPCPGVFGGGKSGLRALRSLWLNLRSACMAVRRIRCERRSRETRRVNVTRPASADCASSWASGAAHPPAAAPTHTTSHPDRSIRRARAWPAGPRAHQSACTSSTSQWPAPTLRHTIRVLNAISFSVQAFALQAMYPSPPARRPRRRAPSILAERCRRS